MSTYLSITPLPKLSAMITLLFAESHTRTLSQAHTRIDYTWQAACSILDVSLSNFNLPWPWFISSYNQRKRPEPLISNSFSFSSVILAKTCWNGLPYSIHQHALYISLNFSPCRRRATQVQYTSRFLRQDITNVDEWIERGWRFVWMYWQASSSTYQQPVSPDSSKQIGGWATWFLS